MHEMALCESLVAIIEERAMAGRFRQVYSVSLDVGVLAGVEIEALRFGFRAVARGTVADGAELKIHAATAHARCSSCQWEEHVTEPLILCPACGGLLYMTGGRELRISEMEVE